VAIAARVFIEQGTTIMPRVWNEPEETAAAMSDGW
jgi:long-subunit acyl-CoA synthetase (AMP-forming)